MASYGGSIFNQLPSERHSVNPLSCSNCFEISRRLHTLRHPVNLIGLRREIKSRFLTRYTQTQNATMLCPSLTPIIALKFKFIFVTFVFSLWASLIPIMGISDDNGCSCYRSAIYHMFVCLFVLLAIRIKYIL
jgi:hypothetical protein